jgi:hypothetical protein
MKLFGYTVGQMLVIGAIALVFIYLAKTINNKTNIPGLHSIIEGS